MADKATDKQKKDEILDADLEYLINEEEKLQEIAQLLSGSKITDAAFLQARELMKL